jgi:drug/metabolite transporter (DMT)-like permease
MTFNASLRRAAVSTFGNAYLLLTFMALFWAGNQVLGRAVAGHIPPVLFSFARWTLAALIVLPFAWPYLKRDWPELRANWKLLTFLGVLGGGAFNTLQYIGLNYTTALNSLVLNSTGPIFIAITCFLIFGDRLTFVQLLGTALSFIGVMVVITRGSLEMLTGLTLNRGDLILLLAMSTTGLYTAFLRKRPNIHWLSFLCAQFVASSLFNVPLAIAEGFTGARPELTLFTILSVAYVAIFPGVVSYLCYIRGVELIGGVRAGIFMHLIPLFGALLAVGLLGEPLLMSHIVGFVLIIGGVALTSRKS